MRRVNTNGLAASTGPRRTPGFADEGQQYAWPERNAAARARRGVWIAMLVILGVAVLATFAVRYARVNTLETLSGGQILKEMTFEGGLTNPRTGANEINNGVTIETAAPLKGIYAAHVSGGSAYLEEPFSAVSDFYVSFYIRLSELPANGDIRLLRVSTGKSTVGNVLLRGGRLRLRSNSKPIGADSAPLVAGQVYRIGLHQRAGTGSTAVLEAFLASGDAPFDVPFAATLAGEWTEGADQVRIGMTTSNGVNAVIDDVRLSAAGMPGPSE